MQAGESVQLSYTGIQKCTQKLLHIQKDGQSYDTMDVTDKMSLEIILEQAGSYECYVSGLFQGVWYDSKHIQIKVLNPLLIIDYPVITKGTELVINLEGMQELTNITLHSVGEDGDLVVSVDAGADAYSLTYEEEGSYQVYASGLYNGSEYKTPTLDIAVCEKIWLDGMSMTLLEDGKLGLNYYILIPSISVAPSYLAILGEGEKAEQIDIDENVFSSEKDVEVYGRSIPCMQYKLTKRLAAAQMTDVVKLNIVENDNLLFTCENSVLDYVALMKAEMPQIYEEHKDIIVAMLNYGAAAQNYFEYQTESLANQIHPEEEKIISTISEDELKGCELSETLSDSPLNGIVCYYGSSLILDSSITLRHYFQLEGENESDNLKFLLGEKEVEPKSNGGLWYVDITDIAADDIFAMQQLTIQGNGMEAQLNYAVGTYLYKAIANEQVNEKLLELVNAMYQYADAILEAR